LSEISNQLEEYFRKSFRKLSFFDAKYIITQLAKGDNSQKIQALDDKFWIWETLEEATRPNVDLISKDELIHFYGGFLLNCKGSEDFHDVMMDRLRLFNVEAPPFTNRHFKFNE
jgi:hypothetical protein